MNAAMGAYANITVTTYANMVLNKDPGHLMDIELNQENTRALTEALYSRPLRIEAILNANITLPQNQQDMQSNISILDVSAQDVTTPDLVSLSLSSYEIDLTNGAISITATARITDNLSGIGNANTKNAEVRWRSPSGNQFIDANFFDYSIGNDLDGTFQNRFPITFNASSENGVWSIETARVNDEAGNTKTYTKQELDALGIRSTLNVNGGSNDITPPDLVSLSLSSYEIDLTNGPVSITALARITDDISGVGNANTKNAEVRWRSPSGNQFIDADFFDYSIGNDLDGTFQNRFPITFNANSENGVWSIETARVNDEAGNVKTYTKQELDALGIRTSLVVGDLTAPTIINISTQGTTVILKLSEAASGTSVSKSAFAIQTVNSRNQVVNRTVTTIELDPNDPTRVFLKLAGAAPASNVNLRASYTDPANNQNIGVIQDVSGNDLGSVLNRFADTFIAAGTTTLASQYQTLTLAGTSAVSGTGNSLANTITGNSAQNTIRGLGGADKLTGLGGIDTFTYTLADSRIGAFDRITDLAIGTDRIDGPRAVSAERLKEVGTVQALTGVEISALLTSTSFPGNGAATFTFGTGSSTRTFLAINDGTPGFSGTNDGLIEITGYSGLLDTLAII